MANAKKHKQRSQYRHFNRIPLGQFYLNAYNKKRIKEQREKVEDFESMARTRRTNEAD